jgi:glycosyltransferase involved in cell wall biosynthesis
MTSIRRHILALPVSGPRGTSARYRLYQFIPTLKASGFHVEVICPSERAPRLASSRGSRAEELYLRDRARSADLVFIQKRLFPHPLLRRMATLGKPFVFDFDDALFTSPQPQSLMAGLQTRARLAGALKAAACVIAGNNYLADFARARARRVELLPTCVDVHRYRAKTEFASRGLNLGWIGARENQDQLATLQPVLAELSPRIPGMRLTVISDEYAVMDGVEVVNHIWSPEDETEAIGAFDIGLMPIKDTAWNRGKCGLKILQYMAAGVPPVCSAMGANLDIIQPGVDGFLCRSPSDWRDAILRLAGDSALRREVSFRARAKVEKLYSTDVIGRKLIDLLNSILREAGQLDREP